MIEIAFDLPWWFYIVLALVLVTSVINMSMKIYIDYLKLQVKIGTEYANKPNK